MSNNLITYAFVAGEISPTLFGRTDLEKYDLGLETCLNFFVDYRGGISTRPGTEFVDYIKNDHLPIRMIPFQFAPNVANTYVILIYSGGIRFVQDGGYVLEASQAITGITQAAPGVVTAAAHGFATGDWVKISGVGGMTRLNGQTFEVGTTTANTFQLLNALTGANYDTSALPAYTSGGTVSRIYTVAQTLTPTQIDELRYHQIRDTIRITHTSMAPRNLTRIDNTNWTFTEESFAGTVGVPTNVTASPSGAGTAEALMGVTAVDADGVESEISNLHLEDSMVDYTTTAGSLSISWDSVDDAVKYNVYRSRVVDGRVHFGDQLGYIGTSFGTGFNDNNILADFAVTPPQFNNPFAPQAITHINVTAEGSAYDVFDTVTVTDPDGSGFRGELVVSRPGFGASSGRVTSIRILNGGSGYTNPTVTISTSTGSGATFDVVVSPATGTFPRISTVFQQRQIYAASLNAPLGIWGSRPGSLSNFDVSSILTDGDAFSFELNSAVVSPILHMVPTRLGLLLCTQSGIWLLSGGTERAITALNALAEPQTSTGISDIPPIPLDTDILYVEDKGRTVRLLGYDELQKAFAGRDMSILANHLFSGENHTILNWSFAAAPYSLVWACREDGRFLSFTMEKEQNVFAWGRHETRGMVEDVLTVEENQTDTLYLLVNRRINNRTTRFLERMASRTFRNVEDAWCVDCALKTTSVTPAAIISIFNGVGTTKTLIANAAVFSAGDVGKVVRAGGGRGTITSFTSTTEVEADFDIDVKDTIPIAGNNIRVASGEWTMDSTFTSVSGLDHLEGQTVKVLLDGVVLADKVVSNGSITLGATGSRAIVGLGFQAVAKTLSPVHQGSTIEAARKNVKGSAVRLHDTLGLKVGTDLDRLYEVRETAAEELGMVRGFKHVLVDSPWDESGQTYYVQDNPLPATILGLVLDLEVGDDTA